MNPGRRVLGKDGSIHFVLLGLTILLVAVRPLDLGAGDLYGRIVYGFVVAVCMATVYGRPRLFFVGLVLGTPALISVVLGDGSGYGGVGLGLGIATLGFVCVVLLLTVFERPKVTAASVASSLTVYLLLGVIWSLAYTLTERLRPGSFYGLGAGGTVGTERELFYYSFVTLASLGYGDIGPVGPEARALVITEAVVGQLYLVVLVASLVGGLLNDQVRSQSE